MSSPCPSPRSVGRSLREDFRITPHHGSPPIQSPRRKIVTGSPLLKTGRHGGKSQFHFERTESDSQTNVAPESLSPTNSFHSLDSTHSKSTSGFYSDDAYPSITVSQESFPSLPTLPDISSPTDSDATGYENESSFVSASDLTIDYSSSPKSLSPSSGAVALSNATIDIPVVRDQENNIVKSSDSPLNLLNVTKNVKADLAGALNETHTIQRWSDTASKDNALNEETFSVETVDKNAYGTCEQRKRLEGKTKEQEVAYCKLDVTEDISPTDVLDGEEELSTEDLNETVLLNNTSSHAAEEELYTFFKPQRQSTSLTLFDGKQTADCQLPEQKQLDISKPLLILGEESETFTSATSEIFQDPESFDFFLAQSTKKPERLRSESLYIKFDPLVSNSTMLSPQENAEPAKEEQNGVGESLENVGTPRRSSAVAAIDRLLFYSPFPSSAESKLDKHEEKKETAEDSKENNDIDMCKELQLVRATVLQLEEELEKQKAQHETELERQSATFQEKISKLQQQLAQEIEDKNQVTVVVEEYEKSISRLVAEKERARATFEHDKVKLNEDLQAANLHLNNTEAAFNDIHQKYERLKGVVAAYKINETVLKEGIQENVETIKALEARYEQLKQHAMSQLEKSNADLDVIRKQHETERIELHLMATRAEVKNNSVTELMEKVTKENQELAQILDEVIARVGRYNVE